MIVMVNNRATVLESIPVDAAMLESANKWFDISWYGLLLAGGITALGAFATVAFLFVQFWSSGVRERNSEWRTSVLELQTAEAKKDTAEAQERIANLNNETARLREAGRANALAAGTTRTVTEQFALALGLVRPGTLSEATRSLQIISKVKPFAGKQFDAIATSSDIELEVLLLSLRHALKAAGWIEVERSDVGTIKSSGGGLALVNIHVDASRDSELLNAAETLASALNAEGIAATVNPKAEPDTTNAAVIHILIGPKP
jgi:hypothetical protein